ncbi:MAG: thioredoxin fold domain-containing protein [Muribaculaceae bacterium]|nr:thioredoxin fold domain-containing protein [Muribaculaceae bacterium]
MKAYRFLFSACVLGTLAFGMVSCGAKQENKDAAAETEQTEAVAEEAETSNDAVVVLKEGEAIAPADGKLVVIDFNATWCGPCKQFAPHFDAVAAENAGKAVFYSVDVDVHPELAAQYGVESIPMVVYIKPDGKTDSTIGYMDKDQFAAAVAANLN